MTQPATADSVTRELTVVQDQPLELMGEIDLDRMKRTMEVFHEFVGSILKPGVHYGKVPGVKKDFLWQPGAEEIFRAFNCRPTYSTISQTVDPATSMVIFHRKCEAVHIDSGQVVGEADAICSSFEKEFEKEDMGRRLNNILMKADKRAFVKCARTLGCASEFFTQDEDMANTGRGAGAGANASKPVDPESGEVYPVGYWEQVGVDDKTNKPQFKVMCSKHGWWWAREWGGRDGKPVTMKCMKNEGTKDKPKYCTFEAPKVQPEPTKADFDEAKLRTLLAETKKPDGNPMKTSDLKDVLGLKADEPFKRGHINAWLRQDPSRTLEQLVQWARSTMPEPVNDDELPFDTEDGEYAEIDESDPRFTKAPADDDATLSDE